MFIISERMSKVEQSGLSRNRRCAKSHSNIDSRLSSVSLGGFNGGFNCLCSTIRKENSRFWVDCCQMCIAIPATDDWGTRQFSVIPEKKPAVQRCTQF